MGRDRRPDGHRSLRACLCAPSASFSPADPVARGRPRRLPEDRGEWPGCSALTTYELLAQGYTVARLRDEEPVLRDAPRSAAAMAPARTHAWPWLQYLARVLAECYDSFEDRVKGAAAERRVEAGPRSAPRARARRRGFHDRGRPPSPSRCQRSHHTPSPRTAT